MKLERKSGVETLHTEADENFAQAKVLKSQSRITPSVDDPFAPALIRTHSADSPASLHRFATYTSAEDSPVNNYKTQASIQSNTRRHSKKITQPVEMSSPYQV